MFHKRLLKEFKCNNKYVVGMILSQWVSLVCNICLVLATSKVFYDLFAGELEAVTVYIYLGILIATLLIRGIMNTLGNRWSYESSANVKMKLRELIYTKLTKLGASYRQVISTQEAVQISTEGVEQLDIYFARYVPQFFYSLLAPLTLFIVVSFMSFKVALILFICVPLIPISIVAVQKFAKKMLHKYWGTYTELGDSFLENLHGLTTLKIYQADERYQKKMDEEAEKFRKVTMKVLIMQLNSISIMDLIAYGGAALGIILAILECRNGNINLGQCFFIIMISAEFFLPLRLLGSFFHIAMNGNAAANKIFRLIDAPEEEIYSEKEITDRDICFEEVSFRYDERKEVLSHVSFHIKESGLISIVGTSGCGKSTLASLIMGDFKEYTGKISFGGISLNKINKDALYQNVTRICHDSYLFKGTVRENLWMGKENATVSQMHQALEKVDLLDTIIAKGGLDMIIDEGATNLSGGQKQRLALARAILHDSEVFIFDEATSNIDVESENKIMEVIHELAKTKIVILISHRLMNVVNSKKIIVLKDGVITEQGNHQTLMHSNSYYASLFMAQQKLEAYGKEAK